MARVFITGSTDGLGYNAARQLLDDGHDVVLHARNETRAQELRRHIPVSTKVLIADLGHQAEVTALAAEANALDPFDAVIHNAGLGYRQHERGATPEGHAAVLAVNVLAPYLLTALMRRPKRLIYLSSGMQQGGEADLDDIDWTARSWDGVQAYSDSKLFDTTLAFAVARRWTDIYSNSVEPGWVATKMGGPGAPDDLDAAHRTQTWLATSNDATATVTGRHFYHQRERAAHPAASSTAFQDRLLLQLDQLTGVAFPTTAA
ncbi:SDR family NAD(P)-dependent oxidoreductase [Amnibacterium setariae]|uniref:SDR family NAD(P)-dependent oxidoreductase n=1 Tax=Amnibacterium setariae TaxID=2306585 RepID=A0A3A1U490_9MICO|nr:SDR family NAD(P)-dependent oxidoreductase [Amnibacterium setariae]RIX28657.1 SDR family NAD(P)-dependent oxidoreductase [Amnibacterium setariae]